MLAFKKDEKTFCVDSTNAYRGGGAFVHHNGGLGAIRAVCRACHAFKVVLAAIYMTHPWFPRWEVVGGHIFNRLQ